MDAKRLVEFITRDGRERRQSGKRTDQIAW
jgi:hypothetical protein